MAYYDALIAAWSATGKPAGVTGTDLANGMTIAEKLAAINGWTVAGPSQLVSRGAVRQHFDNFVDASGIPVWEHIEANSTGSEGLNMACRAALRLRDAPGDYPALDMTAAILHGQVALLVAGSVITQEQSDSLFALGQSAAVSWCYANGLPAEGPQGPGKLWQPDLENAGLV